MATTGGVALLGSGSLHRSARLSEAPTRSDDELLEGLRRGDDRCAERLVRRYAGKLLAVARRYLDDELDAEDAVQEAFLQAFRSIGSFRKESALGTWLYRIVANAALKKIRERERRPETSIEALLPTFDASGRRHEPFQSPPPSVERMLERREVREHVRRSVERLPEIYRSAVLLRDLRGYSTQEAADSLGISPGALKVRLHRGRSALKRMLEPVLGSGRTRG